MNSNLFVHSKYKTNGQKISWKFYANEINRRHSFQVKTRFQEQKVIHDQGIYSLKNLSEHDDEGANFPTNMFGHT